MVRYPPLPLVLNFTQTYMCSKLEGWGLGLWPGSSPADPQTPKNSKTQKSDSKVTFGVPVKVTQKLLKSDSKVTKTVEKVTFESLLSNFWVTFTGTPKVTFESLFRVFEFFGVWGSAGLLPGHKFRTYRPGKRKACTALLQWGTFPCGRKGGHRWKISVIDIQKNSRRLWRSRRRKSSSVPADAANFPAAVFLAGKCPNLGRDSISRCRKIGESFSSCVEICRKTFPAGNFGQPQPSRVFWDMIFLVFVGFCIYHRPGKFFFETRKGLQEILLKWWSCTLFLLWHPFVHNSACFSRGGKPWKTNREKSSNNEIFFFSPSMSLTNRETSA